jgi:hypothetical protein
VRRAGRSRRGMNYIISLVNVSKKS